MNKIIYLAAAIVLGLALFFLLGDGTDKTDTTDRTGQTEQSGQTGQAEQAAPTEGTDGASHPVFIINDSGQGLVECVVYMDGYRRSYEKVPDGATMVIETVKNKETHYIFLVTLNSGRQLYDEFSLITEGDVICDVHITPDDFALMQHPSQYPAGNKAQDRQQPSP